MVLMKGFGYDPGHSIVKARQAGLHPKGILYKPFRLDQLIDVVTTILEASGTLTSQATDQATDQDAATKRALQ